MAITLPNGKICRNLPEQVAANMENIEAIAKILDGLNVHDNVVVIDDITVPLTADELEIVLKEVAFLVYQGQVYLKRTENSTDVYFDLVFSITGTTVLTFNSKEIDVVISTGSLTLTSSSVSTYSKSSLDSSLALKSDITYVDGQIALCAKLTGANFTGPITASSIIENMSGYSFTKATTTKGTFNYIYSGVVKNGNKLTFVNAFTFIKASGATGSLPTGYLYCPSSIMAKIYPAFSTYFVDIKQIQAFKVTYLGVGLISQVLKYGSTRLDLALADISLLEEGEEYYIRQECTILLSDNLAS